MDGFTGFKTAAAEEVPTATAVMDPFHVVRLAGDALDRCRRRVQLAIHGHRGHKDDPLYKSRRTLHTGAGLLTDKQIGRITALFADDAHVEVEATWGIYQRMIAAYRHEDRRHGRELMVKLIESLSTGVPKALVEMITLGRTLRKRRRRAGLLRPTRHVLRTHRSDQRPTRTPTRLRARVPQPHQLHRQELARDRRVQTPTTPPSAVKRRPQPAVSAARASLVSSTEKRSGCQSWGSQSRISSAPSPMGFARGSYPPRTQSASSS